MRRSRLALVSGSNVEAVERVGEIAERLAVRPAALRFLGGQDRVIDGFLGRFAAAEMQRQQFRDFVDAALVKLLERVARRRRDRRGDALPRRLP